MTDAPALPSVVCGRFTREYTWRQVHEFLDLKWPSPESELPPSYNVAPTQRSAIVRLDSDGRRCLHVARWGLVPSWAEDPSIGGRLINARAEGLAETPSFREAFRRRRCVVPISAFYEWQTPAERPSMEEATLFGSGGEVPAEAGSEQSIGGSAPSRRRRGRLAKQPWCIRRVDGDPMCLAGLWERWSGPPEERVAPAAVRPEPSEALETFAIVTTGASAFIAGIHDRMPVILERAEVEEWLAPETSAHRLRELLDFAAEGLLRAYQVSSRVSSPTVDDRHLTVEIVPGR